MCLVERIADKFDVDPRISEDSYPVDLLPWRVARHENASAHFECPAAICHTLRVISCRRTDNSVLSFGEREMPHPIESSAELVRTHDLQVFPLQVYLRTMLFRKPRTELQRRLVRNPSQTFMRLLHHPNRDVGARCLLSHVSTSKNRLRMHRHPQIAQ